MGSVPIDLTADEMHPSPGLRDAFIGAMRRAATGVSVVTTRGQAGQFGVTVSAVASVSADPPLLLVCINRRSPAWAAIQENGVFTVNLLSEAQAHVADSFAGRAPRPPQSGAAFDFNCGRWAMDDDASPRLEDASAAFHCRIAQAHEAGTHAVLIGHVLTAIAGGSAPLAYVSQDYARTARLQPNQT